jgi:drug/metabolite transporter (DMT)-like permease
MGINMLMFFKGLSLTTPINSSVIITISPILVLVMASLLISERITWLKTAGTHLP